jgi:hypothetical protein
MVRGASMTVTAEPFVHQWAEMETMAFGLGSVAANSIHARVKRLSSRVFMGLPWPMNAAGMRCGIGRSAGVVEVDS